jgi:hypothetical protein
MPTCQVEAVEKSEVRKGVAGKGGEEVEGGQGLLFRRLQQLLRGGA